MKTKDKERHKYHETELTMLDLYHGSLVQVQVSTNPDGSETLWVNVDGICRLRACRPSQITINDERRKKKK